jgi:hypothetical protein
MKVDGVKPRGIWRLLSSLGFGKCGKTRHERVL